jgi:hypothetical protein
MKNESFGGAEEVLNVAKSEHHQIKVTPPTIPSLKL